MYLSKDNGNNRASANKINYKKKKKKKMLARIDYISSGVSINL